MDNLYELEMFVLRSKMAQMDKRFVIVLFSDLFVTKLVRVDEKIAKILKLWLE